MIPCAMNMLLSLYYISYPLQVLFPEQNIKELLDWYGNEKDTLGNVASTIVRKFMARKKMQDKVSFGIID